jgi:hypothetical protein
MPIAHLASVTPAATMMGKLIAKLYETRTKIDKKTVQATTQGNVDPATQRSFLLEAFKVNTAIAQLTIFQGFQRQCAGIAPFLENDGLALAVKKLIFNLSGMDPASIHDLPLTSVDIAYARDPNNRNDSFANALKQHPELLYAL